MSKTNDYISKTMEDFINKKLESSPGLQLYNRYADYLYNRGRVDEAKNLLLNDALNKNIKYDEQSLAETHMQIARLSDEIMDTETAEKHFQLANQLCNNNPDILQYHSQFLLNTNKPADALDKINTAIKLNPLNLQSWKIKMECLKKTHYLKEEIEECAYIILEMEPYNTEALEALADIKMSYGEFEDAIKYYKMIPYHENKSEILSKIGESHLSLANFEMGNSYLDKAIDINPEDFQTWSKIIDMNLDIGNIIDAVDNLNVYLDDHPKCPEALAKKAEILSLLKQYDEALDYINNAIEQIGKYEEKKLENAYKIKGDIHYSQKDYQSAKKYYDYLIKNKTSIESILFKWADAMYHLNQSSEALEIMDTLLNDIPSNTKTEHVICFQKSVLLLKLKKFDEAIKICDKSIDIINSDPANHLPSPGDQTLSDILTSTTLNESMIKKQKWYQLKGYILKNAERYDEAIESYEKSLAIRPDSSETLNELAQVYIELGSDEDALEYAEDAIEFNNYFIDAYVTKGHALYNMQRYKETIEILNESIDIAPTFDATFLRARAAFEIASKTNDKNDYKYAFNLYNVAKGHCMLIDRNDLLSNVYDDMCEIYLKIDDYQEAIDCAYKAYELDKNNENALYTAGVAHFKSGDYVNALNDFEKARKINPRPKILYDLACAQVKNNKIDDAVESLKQAIENDHSFAEYAKYDPDIKPVKMNETIRNLIIEKTKKDD